MSLAKRMQKTATKLLSKFDESDGRIKLLRQGAPYWDDTLAEIVPGDFEEVPLVGVTNNYAASLIDGTNIKAGDIQVIATSAEPIKMNDKLLIDGAQWSVVNQPIIDYTGGNICYKAQCRK